MASTRGVILRLVRLHAPSSCAVAPAAQARLQARQRLAVQLADPRFGHLEHGADLLQVQFLLVVERHHQRLALRQVVDRTGQRLAERLVGPPRRADRHRSPRCGRDRPRRPRSVVEADSELAARRIVDDAVVLVELDAQARGDVRVARLPHRARARARASPPRHARALRCTERGAQSSLRSASSIAPRMRMPGVGLEARAAVRREVLAPPRAGRACRPGSGRRRRPTAAGARPGGTRCASPVRHAGSPAHPGRSRRGVACACSIWIIAPPRGRRRRPRTRRSTKNSRWPRGPSGTGQSSARRARRLNARADGLSGIGVQRPAAAPHGASDAGVVGHLAGVVEHHVEEPVRDALERREQPPRPAAGVARHVGQHPEAPHAMLAAQHLDQRIGIGDRGRLVAARPRARAARPGRSCSTPSAMPAAVSMTSVSRRCPSVAERTARRPACSAGLEVGELRDARGRRHHPQPARRVARSPRTALRSPLSTCASV